MKPPRRLIVNADDFGLSPGVNRGIVKAHEQGVVTGASLMVRWPSAADASDYARHHPSLSVGLHVDLCEWMFDAGKEEWRPVYEVVPATDAAAVETELARQLAAFRHLMGREPTHLDSHQHVHLSEPVKSAMQSVAREMGIVLRSLDPNVRYCGEFYGQSNKGYPYPAGISVEALLKILRELPSGWTEIGCHPGEGGDVRSVYSDERSIELDTLCDPRIAAAIAAEGITLCGFPTPHGG